MKTRTSTASSRKTFFTITAAMFVASIILFVAGQPWLGGIALYLGATMFVLLFNHSASILSRRGEEHEMATAVSTDTRDE